MAVAMVVTPTAYPVEASPGTIYVPDDYPTIQQAVDNATSGDTIIVRDGNYTENVVVVTDNLTITSENGTAFTVVEAANPDADVFNITASYVTLSGFGIEGATGDWMAGIYLSGASSGNISQNIVRYNCIGIYLNQSSNSTVAGNIASYNTRYIPPPPRRWGRQ